MDHAEPAFGQFDPTDRWKGWVTAADPESGEVRWKVQTPKPMVAAVTATAGGVVFTGDLDGNVLAYDAHDAGGKQCVAVAAGLNSAIWPVKGGPARVMIYALPWQRDDCRFEETGRPDRY